MTLRVRCGSVADVTTPQREGRLCHVWTAPSWQGQNFTSRCWSVQPCIRPVSAVRMTAGHNTLRGSGPGQKPAFDDALAHVGCPDRRIETRSSSIVAAESFTGTSTRDRRRSPVPASPNLGLWLTRASEQSLTRAQKKEGLLSVLARYHNWVRGHPHRIALAGSPPERRWPARAHTASRQAV